MQTKTYSRVFPRSEFEYEKTIHSKYLQPLSKIVPSGQPSYIASKKLTSRTNTAAVVANSSYLYNARIRATSMKLLPSKIAIKSLLNLIFLCKLDSVK